MITDVTNAYVAALQLAMFGRPGWARRRRPPTAVIGTPARAATPAASGPAAPQARMTGMPAAAPHAPRPGRPRNADDLVA